MGSSLKQNVNFSPMAQEISLTVRAARSLGTALVLLAAILFVSGSLRFWQGGLFLALMAGFWIFFLIDLLKHDPQLVERRLRKEETAAEQKLFQRLFISITFSGFLLAGLDFRFGWSRGWLGPIPLALVVAAQVALVAGYWLVFWAMKTNSFAGATIQVEAEQSVMVNGPSSSCAPSNV